MNRLRQLACAIAIGILPTAVGAAPYAITYSGTIADSGFSEIIDGQSFSVTLVFDNGNASNLNQTWTGQHLQCALWVMNNDESVTFTHNLSSESGLSVDGTTTTDGAGTLASVFDYVIAAANPGNYSYSGFTPVAPIDWYLNEAPAIFYDDSRSFDDSLSGVPMETSDWNGPVPFNGDCPTFPAPAPEPIPTLSEWASIALAALLGIGAALGLRRKPPTAGV